MDDAPHDPPLASTSTTSSTGSVSPAATATSTTGLPIDISVDTTPALEAAWAKVEQSWDDPSAHDKLVGLCASLGRLEFAGRRYREVRERDPERAARAQQSIDRIVALAMQTLELHRDPAPPSPKRILFPVALLLVTALVGTAIWVWLDAAR
jgi:hypothetical protein